MFPLNMTILPGGVFRSRIFEPRYLKLVDHCITAKVGFGVCLIEKGHEVGGQDERFEYGVLSRIEQIEEVVSGQLLVSCVGRERIRVSDWHRDQPYPTASIETREVQAHGEITFEQLEDVRLITNRTGESIFKLTGLKHPKVDLVGATAIEAIYHLAEYSYLGAYDRYQILAAETLTERFELLHELIKGIDEIYLNELKIRNESD